MAIKTAAELKAYFETGDTPTQSQFVDLIDTIFSMASTPDYKIYRALLTQTGTDAPVATVLENTLGDIVWTRSGVGHYIGVLAGAFTANKTICPQFPALRFEGNGTYFPIASDAFNQLGAVIAFCQDDTNFEIQTTDLNALSEWSTILGSSFLIEIIVYN